MKQSKMRIFSVLFALLPLSILASLSGCASLEGITGITPPSPTVSLRGFTPSSIDMEAITFQLEMEVKNPYPAAIPVEQIELRYFIEDTEVFQAVNSTDIRIPARNSQVSSFAVRLPFDGISNSVRNYSQQEFLDTRVDMLIRIPLPNIPGLPRTMEFSKTAEVRIPALKPRVRILNFQVDPPSREAIAAAARRAGNINLDSAVSSFSGLLSGRQSRPAINPQDLDVPFNIRFTIDIENQTAAQIDFPQLDFSMQINGNTLLEGESRTVSVRNGHTIIEVVNSFSSRQLGASVLSAFQQGSGTYTIQGAASLQLPAEYFPQALVLDFTHSGAFGSLR